LESVATEFEHNNIIS